MKTRPQLTEEEIKTFMDFDAILEQKDKLLTKQGNIRRIRNHFIGFVCLLTIPSLIFFLSGREEQDRPLRVATGPSQPSLSPVASTDTIQSKQSREDKQSPPVMKQGKEKPSSFRPKATQEKETLDDKEQAEPRQPVYVQAEPVDGYPALYDYFDKYLVYPSAAEKDQVEGVVDVTFAIDTTGKALNINVENSLGEVFDKEVVLLMEKMPAWRPASYNGKPVQSKISLPITFSVKKSANP